MIQSKWQLLCILLATYALPVVSDDTQQAQDGTWKNQSCSSMYLPQLITKKRVHAYSTVVFDITADGKVENIRIKESSAQGLLDVRAKKAIKRWRYFAYIEDGKEAPRRDVEVTFTYGGDAKEQELTCLHTPWPEEASSDGNSKYPFNELKSCYSPIVPMQMARKRIAAQVDLNFSVSTKGVVKDIEVLSPTINKSFDANAVKALSRWQYHPFIKQGTPVERSDLKVSFFFGDQPENTTIHKCQHAPWEAANSYKFKNVYSRESDKKPISSGFGLTDSCCR